MMEPLKDYRMRGKAMTNVYSVEEWKGIIAHIIDHRGDHANCSTCNATIYWLTFADGKKAPFNEDGKSHFATCPNAKRHRKGK